MAFTRLVGAARAECICATEGCGGAPAWELEVCGIGSIYCAECKKQIEWIGGNVPALLSDAAINALAE